MANVFHVELVGFTEFERKTFESFFKLSARRIPGYVWTSERARADFLVVDTDAGFETQAHAGLIAARRVVLVGTQVSPDAGAPVLKRPIHFFGLLRVLDEMVAARSDAGRESTAASPVGSSSRGLRASGAEGAPAPAASPNRTSSLSHRSSGGHQSAGAEEVMASDDVRYDHILVVDDSPLAQRFMQSRLERFRFRVHLAQSGDEAMRMVQERSFYFVFLDVNMPGLDGYQTCKQIKSLNYPNGGRAPIVAMLTSRSGAIDKIRGTLAGCDAYLTKPLEERELTDAIANFDDSFKRGFDSTIFKQSVQ